MDFMSQKDSEILINEINRFKEMGNDYIMDNECIIDNEWIYPMLK